MKGYKSYGKKRSYRRRSYGRKAQPRGWLSKAYGAVKGYGLNNIVKDVMMLKSLINVEKKRIDTKICNVTPFGQCNINADAYLYGDITPAIVQGLGVAERTGGSVKLTSMSFNFQAISQVNLQTALKFKVWIVRLKDASTEALTTIANQLLVPNVFSGRIDYNSERNPDYFNNFQVLACRKYKINADNFATQANRFVDGGINLKLNHHVRWDGNGNVCTQGQIVMFITADTGNMNTGTASTLTNIANPGVSTGAVITVQTKYFYVDN